MNNFASFCLLRGDGVGDVFTVDSDGEGIAYNEALVVGGSDTHGCVVDLRGRNNWRCWGNPLGFPVLTFACLIGEANFENFAARKATIVGKC